MTPVTTSNTVSSAEEASTSIQSAKSSDQSPTKRRPRMLKLEKGSGLAAIGDTAPVVLGILDSNGVSSLSPGTYSFRDVTSLDRLIEENHRVVDESDKEFIRLRDSVLMAGVKEPIHLFLEKTEKGDIIKIVAGHRRTRVVRSLREIGNHLMLPAILEVPSDSQDKATVINRFVTAAVTNIVRQKLRGLERARAIQDLLKSGMKVDQVTLTVGVDRKTVERSQLLLLLPPAAQDFITTHIHELREKCLFAIAQIYKNEIKALEALTATMTTAAKDAEINRVESGLMDRLRSELQKPGSGGESTADTLDSRTFGLQKSGRGKKRAAVPAFQIPEGLALVSEERFRARLVLDKLPAATLKLVLAALDVAKAGPEEVV